MNKKDSKLELIRVIELPQCKSSQPIKTIHKHNKTVYANCQKQIYEIDTKHNIVYTNQLQNSYLNIKYLNKSFYKGTYYVTADKITQSDDQLISSTNSKANFIGEIDGAQNNLIFTKFHKNHHKYSLNLLKLESLSYQSINNQKKIIQLFDSSIDMITIDKRCKWIYYQQQISRTYQRFNTNQSFKTKHSQKPKQQFKEQAVKMISIEKPDSNDLTILKKGSFVSDDNNIYLFNQQKKGVVQIFDERMKKNGVSWKYIQQNQSRASLVNQKPFKIQNFGHKIITASSQSVQIFDIRNLSAPYIVQKIKQKSSKVSDFIYQPNIQQLYIIQSKKLKVFSLR